MRILLSLAALLLSVILLQLSSGGLGPLDALSGFELNFTTAQIGLLGSAHFVGFFIGCWWAPRLLGTVGHSRAFAAFAATGAIGLLAHMLIIDPTAWAVMRVATGLCVAGCYTVIEAWLQAKVTNQTRGQTMGAYRAVDLGSARYVSYNILALLCCATLIPLALTKSRPPETPKTTRLRPMLAVRNSSLAAFVLGGALAQIPIGWLADKYDRRKVLIWLSVAAVMSCLATILVGGYSTTTIFLTALFFGLTTFPIFSVAAAHAHDFVQNDERVELSAALMFYFALGAIAAPLFASFLIDRYGPSALFVMIASGHILLILFGLSRMRARPTRTERTPYIYARAPHLSSADCSSAYATNASTRRQLRLRRLHPGKRHSFHDQTSDHFGDPLY